MGAIERVEAGEHLLSILSGIDSGKEVVITRNGRDIARVLPIDRWNRAEVAETVDRLRQFGGDNRLRGLSIRELIDEGRP